MIDRRRFFALVTASLFGGIIHQHQVDGCTAILDTWEKRDDLRDLRWLAYMLATAKWETGHTMQPVEEVGRGAGRRYGDPVDGIVYYGRGYVQLTWWDNYKKMSAWTGVDLVKQPELALDPKIAAIILFEGMIHGVFTGVGLARYFSETVDDPVNARRIINGTDHADDIAAIHRGFLAALEPA